MSKGVFFCVGTGGHVLPVLNIIKTISKKGINESDILVITDIRGEQYFSNSSL
jgi:UDP-N-acetylglucosamine:LPS N-acetylglucosamine transferase